MTIHQHVTLSGGSGTPTGTVDFTRYKGLTCSGIVEAAENDVPLEADGSTQSTPWVGTAGWHSYRAHYDGDSTYAADTSPCHAVNVRKRVAKVQSLIHDSQHNDISGQTVSPGTEVHDLARVTAVGPQPTGTVDFFRWDNDSCEGDPVSTENDVALVNGEAESSTFTVGSSPIAYRVFYDGDANFKAGFGPCEPLGVQQFTPDVTTEVHNEQHEDITNMSVPANTSVHDKAIVTSTGPAPTGTVDFALFTNSSCDGDPSSTEVDVALDANGEAESTPFTPEPGTYSYLVHYDGDANNEEADGPCEPFGVARFVPLVATEVHDPQHQDITNQTVAAGTVVHDKAIVTGNGPEPTGTVDFTLTTGANCNGSVVSTENDVALVDGMAESSTFVTTEGSFSYRVHYDGNANYDPANGPCEPFHVEQGGAEGCTPGYWKQTQHFDSWTGFSPGDSFEQIFQRDAYAGMPSLLGVLELTGGGLNALGRQSVAALLNATSSGVDYPFTSQQVIAMFQAAFDSGNAKFIESTKNTLDRANNGGCGLN
jgi:hypothetical protein